MTCVLVYSDRKITAHLLGESLTVMDVHTRRKRVVSVKMFNFLGIQTFLIQVIRTNFKEEQEL